MDDGLHIVGYLPINGLTPPLRELGNRYCFQTLASLRAGSISDNISAFGCCIEPANEPYLSMASYVNFSIRRRGIQWRLSHWLLLLADRPLSFT